MRDLDTPFAFCKSLVFASTAILTLAFVSGANKAIYTVVDRVCCGRSRIRSPIGLAMVTTHFERRGNNESGQTGGIPGGPARHVTLADVAVVGGVGMGVNLVAHDQPQDVQLQRVSAGFFRVLAVAPTLGREFTGEEDRAGGPAVALLSHELWTRLGADASLSAARSPCAANRTLSSA